MNEVDRMISSRMNRVVEEIDDNNNNSNHTNNCDNAVPLGPEEDGNEEDYQKKYFHVALDLGNSLSNAAGFALFENNAIQECHSGRYYFVEPGLRPPRECYSTVVFAIQLKSYVDAISAVSSDIFKKMKSMAGARLSHNLWSTPMYCYLMREEGLYVYKSTADGLVNTETEEEFTPADSRKVESNIQGYSQVVGRIIAIMQSFAFAVKLDRAISLGLREPKELDRFLLEYDPSKDADDDDSDIGEPG